MKNFKKFIEEKAPSVGDRVALHMRHGSQPVHGTISRMDREKDHMRVKYDAGHNMTSDEYLGRVSQHSFIHDPHHPDGKKHNRHFFNVVHK